MEFNGKVIQVFEQKSGVSQSTGKEWRSQEFVVETHDQYPKKCCFKAFNDVCNVVPAVGDEVKVSFDIDCREYNGRWYNDVKAYKVEKAGDAALQQAVAQPQQASAPMQAPTNPPVTKDGDSLPF